MFKKEVWAFPFQIGTEHPAAIPAKTADNIIDCVANGERITVLDPFREAETTAKVGQRNTDATT